MLISIKSSCGNGNGDRQLFIKGATDDRTNSANSKRLFIPVVGETRSDAFGDFKLDQLPRDLGPVTLHVEFETKVKTLELELNQSLYAGCVEI